MTRRPTVFFIPSPWSGDEADPIPLSYRIWWLAYVTTRQIRHWLPIVMHDWEPLPEPNQFFDKRCAWCGIHQVRLTWKERGLISIPVVILVVGSLIIGFKNGWS